jgi:ATP-binding cassette subfamily B protein
MKLKYIQQYDEKDCGPTCLAMIAQYYGKRVSIPKLREMAKTDKLGTNLYGLIKAGEKIGIQLTGVEAESVDDLKEAEFPMIAHIINQQGYDHFVIIEDIKNNKIHIVDPGKGRGKLTENEFKKQWTNIAVLVEKMDTFTTDNASPSYMKIFVDIFKTNKLNLLMLALMSFGINMIGVVGAIFFKYLTDDIIPSNLVSELHFLGIGILLLYITSTVMTYIRYEMILRLSLKIDIDLMKNYFHHVLHLPMNFFNARKSGEILQRFMDTSKIREALSSSTVTLLVDTLMIIIGGVLLYLQSPFLLLITIIFIPLLVICAYALKKPFEHYNQKVAENDAELSSHLIESFDGSQTIKSYQSEADVYDKGVDKFNQLIKSLLKLGRFSNLQLSFNSFLKMLIGLVILWVGGHLVMEGEMTLGSLLAFNALTIYYLDPIERLINIQPTLQSSFVAARRIAEITDLEKERENKTDDLPYHFEKSIRLDNVSFQYGFRSTVLSNVSININKGQKIAIVGESGSGKTTIGKLLNGYYEVNDGDILIDGQSISKIKLSELRKRIGYVSQDTFLFADTITNNLLHGCNKSKTEEEMVEACEYAEALHFIHQLPSQFETMLEKGGSNLSGGQAQRLSLARTFLKEPDIYIFDEATSALDSKTERNVMENMDKLVEKGKTAVIISHKLSTVKNADYIYVLKDGEICEEGQHEGLLHNKGAYHDLWQLQV